MPSRPQQRPAPQDPKAELAKQARLWGLAVICAAAGAGTVAATGTLLPGIGVFLITLLVLGPLLYLLEKRIREKPGPPVTDTDQQRSDQHHRREIVSYVRRSDRLSPAQQKWWDRHHDDWVAEVPRGDGQYSIADEHRIDPVELFGRHGELVVEIGPGMGDSLAPMAAARPDADVLAFEVYQPAVARILAKLSTQQVTNVRVVQADAVHGLLALEEESVAELWMFFPDPWHKTKHRKRRLVTTEFAELVASRLRPGARWRLATDWPDYAKQMHRVLDDHPRFEVGDHDRADRPLTKFERRGTDEGRPSVDLVYRRR